MSQQPLLVILNDTAVIPHHGCKVVMKRIVDFFGERGYRMVTVSVYSDWHIYEDIVAEATAVIVNGEGTIHHSAPRGKVLTEVAPFCRERGIPVFLVNSVWQDNSDEMAQNARAFDRVWVRESFSHKQLAARGVEASTVADLTVGWAYGRSTPAPLRSGTVFTDAVGMPVTDQLHSLAQANPESRFVTLTPPPGSRGEYGLYEFERLRPRWRKFFLRTLRSKVIRFIKLALIVRGKLIYRSRLARGTLEEYAINDFMGLLERTQLVVTGRFHVVCLCLVTGTPFIAVASNSHKIEGMLHDAGLTDRIVSSSQLDQWLRSPAPWTDAHTRAAREFVESATRAQEDMFETIHRHIGESAKREGA